MSGARTEIHPGFGIGAEEAGDVALDVAASDGAAIFGQEAIIFREDGRESSARVGPFVDDLLEDAGVGMLRDEAGAEHFDALARDFFNDRGVVHEPPAAEGHEVVEFSGEDAEFVLIFAAENASEKTVRGKITAEIFESDKVSAADGVARKSDAGVHLFADADHERERKFQFVAGRKDSVAEQEAVKRVAGKFKGVRQRASHVNGAHAFGPIGEETANFGNGFAGSVGVDGVALRGKCLPMLLPSVEDAIEAKHSVELMMARGAVQPERGFGGIERVVGHDDAAEAGHLKDARNVGLEVLLFEKRARFGKRGIAGGQLEGVQNGDNAASRFGDGRVFDEQSAADEVGLLGFGERPVVLRSHVGGAKKFGFEIVVGEELVDTPQRKIGEGGGEEVGVNIDERSGGKDFTNGGKDLWSGKRDAVRGNRGRRRRFEKVRGHASIRDRCNAKAKANAEPGGWARLAQAGAEERKAQQRMREACRLCRGESSVKL